MDIYCIDTSVSLENKPFMKLKQKASEYFMYIYKWAY